MNPSKTLIDHIKQAEGFSEKAYWDQDGGVWTIGYGHTRSVKRGDVVSKSEAERLIVSDLKNVTAYLNTIKEINTQGKFDACADFCFNIGTGAFKSSTLLKLIKTGAPDKDIQAQFRRWVYSGGKKLPGLVTRRGWEAKRWAER